MAKHCTNWQNPGKIDKTLNKWANTYKIGKTNIGQTGKNTGQIFKTLDQGQMVTEAPINILKFNKVPVSNMERNKENRGIIVVQGGKTHVLDKLM